MTFSKLGTDTNTGQFVYLPKTARLQGLYIIGIQGTGKSGLIENLIMQDIDQQIGVCVLDPHGELIDHVIARLDPKRVNDVILLHLADYNYPFGMNLFTCSDLTNPLEVQNTVDQVLHIFEKLLGVSLDTPLILEYLYNCTYTLVANPGYTMADIPLLLQDEQCRRKLVAHVSDIDVLNFWKQHDQKKPSDQNNDISSTLRRVKQFLQPLSRPIVGQSKTTIDLQKIMHEGKILLVKLSAQVDSVSSLIGSLIVALLLNAAYNRPAQRRQFHLYADEFQRFATEDFATLLEEARKYGVATTIAHQNRGQLNSANSKLETDLKDRSRSVGNLVVFKINSKDADDLAGEFDTSPPPAKPEEVGRRKKQTPVLDVAGWLLSGKGTSSNVIISDFAQKLHGEYAELIGDPVQINDVSRKHDLNDILSNAMQKKPIKVSRQFFASLARIITITVFSAGGKSPTAYSLSLSEFPNSFNIKNLHADRMTHPLSMLLSIPASYPQYAIALQELVTLAKDSLRILELAYLLGWMQAAVNGRLSVCQAEPWFKIIPDQINTRTETYTVFNRDLPLGYQERIGYIPLPNQEQKFYREADLMQYIEELLGYETPVLLDLVSEFKQVMQALAANPILADSGEEEVITRPGTVRPYQDVKNDIANQLSGLPPFTARVKIGTNAPQNPGKKCLSCGNQNVSGAIYCVGCGTKLPAPNEYTIATLKPAGGITTQQLDQRIKQIQARNVQDGYTRSRQDVEAEILQRQQSFQPVHVSPQVPQQKPRHARQVPVQGNCPNCGKSNPPGSQFCNQCGTKL